MRGLFATLFLAATALGAGELDTNASHEVRWVPPPPVPVRGPRFCEVTIDLYFAFGHGPSAVGAELARRAVETARTHDVRELIRLATPGPISNSPGAELGAEALLEAEAQGKPFELLDLLLRERLPLTAPELERAARQVGLDGDRLAAALADHRHQLEVERRLKEASLAGHSAGELFVNGKRSSVWTSEDGFSSTVKEARARAQQLIAEGAPTGKLYDQLTDPTPRDEPRNDLRGKKRLQPDLTGAPTRGPPLAPVTIVIFSNLACSACSDTTEVLRRLRDAWPGRIREVWRNYVPAYATSGTVDQIAAELAATAAEKDRFWALHDAVLSQARAPLPRRSRAELEMAALTVGIDPLQPTTQAAKRQVERDQAEARRLGVPFAPSLVVNGIVVIGATTFDRLDRVVRAELERGLSDRLAP